MTYWESLTTSSALLKMLDLSSQNCFLLSDFNPQFRSLKVLVWKYIQWCPSYIAKPWIWYRKSGLKTKQNKTKQNVENPGTLEGRAIARTKFDVNWLYLVKGSSASALCSFWKPSPLMSTSLFCIHHTLPTQNRVIFITRAWSSHFIQYIRPTFPGFVLYSYPRLFTYL